MLADDVDEESWTWLRESQRREARTFAELFGLELEIRAEGVAAIDPRDELTDETFPRGGTLGHAALLAVSEWPGGCGPRRCRGTRWSARCPCRRERSTRSWPRCSREHHPRWKQEYVGHPERLAGDVEDLLLAMGLLRRGTDGHLRLAAVANRYAARSRSRPARPRLRLPGDNVVTTHLLPGGDDPP